VPVEVADVRRAGDRHAVILAARGGRRLTIWVGPSEATAIVSALEGIELPRPGTHHLSAALLQAAGTSVAEVRVTRLADAVFYADVVLTSGQSVDARPSDGIALALVAGAPILVSGEVFDHVAPAELQAEIDAATDDRRVLAAETRERLARNAEELQRLSRP
jgi:bifunctional DNase/RNase